MGQAKNRGTREERIEQSKVTRQPPKPGTYVSTKAVNGMSLVVDEVTVPDDDADFFLVSMIDEPSANDVGALGDELDPDQWFALVEQYGLVHTDI